MCKNIQSNNVSYFHIIIPCQLMRKSALWADMGSFLYQIHEFSIIFFFQISADDDQLLHMFNREELITYFNQKIRVEQLAREVAIAEKNVAIGQMTLCNVQNQVPYKHLKKTDATPSSTLGYCFFLLLFVMKNR